MYILCKIIKINLIHKHNVMTYYLFHVFVHKLFEFNLKIAISSANYQELILFLVIMWLLSAAMTFMTYDMKVLYLRSFRKRVYRRKREI